MDTPPREPVSGTDTSIQGTVFHTLETAIAELEQKLKSLQQLATTLQQRFEINIVTTETPSAESKNTNASHETPNADSAMEPEN